MTNNMDNAIVVLENLREDFRCCRTEREALGVAIDILKNYDGFSSIKVKSEDLLTFESFYLLKPETRCTIAELIKVLLESENEEKKND